MTFGLLMHLHLTPYVGLKFTWSSWVGNGQVHAVGANLCYAELTVCV